MPYRSNDPMAPDVWLLEDALLDLCRLAGHPHVDLQVRSGNYYGVHLPTRPILVTGNPWVSLGMEARYLSETEGQANAQELRDLYDRAYKRVDQLWLTDHDAHGRPLLEEAIRQLHDLAPSRAPEDTEHMVLRLSTAGRSHLRLACKEASWSSIWSLLYFAAIHQIKHYPTRHKELRALAERCMSFDDAPVRRGVRNKEGFLR